MLYARDVMNSKVVTVSPETTVAETINALVENRVSGLPVVDACNQVLGIITEFAALAATYDPQVAAEPVGRHMTKDVITVASDASITRVADLFIVHRIRRVLVVDDGRLTGLISRRDLLKASIGNRGLTERSPLPAERVAASTSP